jgi:hypothetical protein
VPEIVTLLFEPTLAVVTGKVTLGSPAGTVTLAGTVAAEVLLLDSANTTPPAAAAPFSITVPVEGVPPFTLVGLRLKEEREGRFTVNVAVFMAAPSVAEIVTLVEY